MRRLVTVILAAVLLMGCTEPKPPAWLVELCDRAHGDLVQRNSRWECDAYGQEGMFTS